MAGWVRQWQGASAATSLELLPQCPTTAACPGPCASPHAVPVYWENRWGTPAAPIIIEAADGAGSVWLDGTSTGDMPMNVFNCRHESRVEAAGDYCRGQDSWRWCPQAGVEEQRKGRRRPSRSSSADCMPICNPSTTLSRTTATTPLHAATCTCCPSPCAPPWTPSTVSDAPTCCCATSRSWASAPPAGARTRAAECKRCARCPCVGALQPIERKAGFAPLLHLAGAAGACERCLGIRALLLLNALMRCRLGRRPSRSTRPRGCGWRTATSEARSTTRSTAWPARWGGGGGRQTDADMPACVLAVGRHARQQRALPQVCDSGSTRPPPLLCLQYGHILNSRLHSSEWGVYVKGGSGELEGAGQSGCTCTCTLAGTHMAVQPDGRPSVWPQVTHLLPAFRLPNKFPSPVAPLCSLLDYLWQRGAQRRHHRHCCWPGHRV